MITQPVVLSFHSLNQHTLKNANINLSYDDRTYATDGDKTLFLMDTTTDHVIHKLIIHDRVQINHKEMKFTSESGDTLRLAQKHLMYYHGNLYLFGRADQTKSIFSDCIVYDCDNYTLQLKQINHSNMSSNENNIGFVGYSHFAIIIVASSSIFGAQSDVSIKYIDLSMKQLVIKQAQWVNKVPINDEILIGACAIIKDNYLLLIDTAHKLHLIDVHNINYGTIRFVKTICVEKLHSNIDYNDYRSNYKLNIIAVKTVLLGDREERYDVIKTFVRTDNGGKSGLTQTVSIGNHRIKFQFWHVSGI